MVRWSRLSVSLTSTETRTAGASNTAACTTAAFSAKHFDTFACARAEERIFGPAVEVREEPYAVEAGEEPRRRPAHRPSLVELRLVSSLSL